MQIADNRCPWPSSRATLARPGHSYVARLSENPKRRESRDGSMVAARVTANRRVRLCQAVAAIQWL